MSRTRSRIVIVDDHRLVAEGIRAMLSRRFDVVGTADSGKALRALLLAQEAECVLLDLAMPGVNGLELIPVIQALRPGIRILIVTMHLDRSLANAALDGGADGFVPKDCGREELVAAIEAVLAGDKYVSPRVPKATNRVSLHASHLAFARLTPRQQQILQLIADGKTTQEMSAVLGVTPYTVTYHRANLRRVLGIKNELGLVRFAVLVQVGERASARVKSHRPR